MLKDLDSVPIERLHAENVLGHPRHAERESGSNVVRAVGVDLIVFKLDNLEVAVGCFAKLRVMTGPHSQKGQS